MAGEVLGEVGVMLERQIFRCRCSVGSNWSDVGASLFVAGAIFMVMSGCHFSWQGQALQMGGCEMTSSMVGSCWDRIGHALERPFHPFCVITCCVTL